MDVWKFIPGYEGLYQVNQKGDVKALSKFVDNGHNIRKTKEKILKRHICRIGYSKHYLFNDKFGRKEHKTHRLVAITFIENPENKPDVNHLDGDKLNNFIDNLQWVTKSENSTHAYENKLHNWSKYKHPTKN